MILKYYIIYLLNLPSFINPKKNNSLKVSNNINKTIKLGSVLTIDNNNRDIKLENIDQ